MSTTPSVGDSAANSPSPPPPAPKKRFWRDWDNTLRVTFIGTVAGVLALIVAIGEWRWPKAESASTAQPGSTSTASTSGSSTSQTAGNPRPSSMPGSTGSAVEYLSTLEAEVGGQHIVPVPTAVRNAPGYASHPVAFACPTNAGGDQVHDIAYDLQQRYLEFRATMRPFYSSDTSGDARTNTFVEAQAGFKQRDGTITTPKEPVEQYATMTQARSLSIDVEGAQKLTLRIRCDRPGGFVVLTDARLIPTD